MQYLSPNYQLTSLTNHLSDNWEELEENAQLRYVRDIWSEQPGWEEDEIIQEYGSRSLWMGIED